MKFRSVVIIAALAAASCSRQAPSLAGDWDATIVSLADAEVPFRFVIGGTPDAPTGTFVNGDERIASTGGSFKDGQLVINFDQYGSKVIARVNGDRLEGEYNRTTRGAAYPFRATRAAAKPKDSNPPQIAGDWKIPTPDGTVEKAWLLIVRQNGADVSAAVQRVDGDSGTLTGSFLAPRGEGQDRKLLLSHFSGARPLRLEVTVKPDGTLDLLEDGKIPHSALRMNDPRAASAGELKDPTQLTRAKDPKAPLQLEFPDLDGTPVSLSDARFRGKVVILSITGSWCPNCHDEAPFFVDLYRKYHDQGLEIVLLAFEEAGQLDNPVRLRAFLKQYAITYPVLLVGAPNQMTAMLPQFEDLYAFPTSIYVGRDGRVRGTHAGFSGKATGELYTQTTGEITRTVEKLLAETVDCSRAGLVSPACADVNEAGLTRPALQDLTRPALHSRTPPQRVSVYATAKRRSKASYDLVLRVQPHERMHVYAPGATGYTAIALTFASAPGVTVAPARFPKAEDFYFAPTKEHFPVYQQTFDVAASATVPATTTTIDATLTYQACDDRLCYAPQSLPVFFDLSAVAR